MNLPRVMAWMTGLGTLALNVGSASAAVQLGSGPDNGFIGGFSDLPTAIHTIFNFVIILAAVIFVILFLVGGVQYLTAAGNEEATGKAKRLLVDAIVGLVIVLAAWAVGTFILNQLGVNVNLNSAGGGTGTSGKGK